MERGHAEALMPLLQRLIARQEGGFASLDRIAVSVGPGSFTGLRVAISAARAIALGTGKPCVGVTTLSAYAAPVVAAGVGTLVATAIDARHNHVYLQVFGPAGRTVVTRASSRRATPRGSSARARCASSGPARRCSRGRPTAIGLDATVLEAGSAPDVVWIARLGAAGGARSWRPPQAPSTCAPRTPSRRVYVRIPRR